MKHVELWATIAAEAGIATTSSQLEGLQTYHNWLESEAIPAGGLGPGEGVRLATRHIGDSLLFLHAIPSASPILDVGSGVGLPGIPLAITRPETEFILIDRSGRRADLLRRAVQILELGNVRVELGDILNWDQPVPALVSRATIPPPELLPLLRTVLIPNGTAVLGGSWTEKPEFEGYITKEIGSKILAQPVWILIMQRT